VSHGTDLDAERAAAAASFTSRYRLDRALGSGGMGEVFAATDLELHREVAVKRLADPFATDETARARFLREAWALARLNHPNVVAVFDVGEHEGRPSLVMELVRGRSLQRVMRTSGALPPDRVASIAGEIARGLGAAHARGIVHRDVKPSNVIITEDGKVKLVDFGIARVRDAATLTRTGLTFGSPAYMAPEQLTGSGRTVDARADLYALGCVLFEMLVGHPPFEGDEAVSVSYRQVHEAPPPIEAIRPEVPPALAALTERLLAKDPDRRPGSAAEVVATLEGAPPAPAAPPVDTRPTAPIPSRVERHPPRVRASWIPWAVAGAALVALVALLTQITGDAEPSAPPAASNRSSAPSSPSSSPSPSPLVASGGPAEAAGALLDLTHRLEASGQIDEHTASDIEHALDDVLRRGGEDEDPEKALEKLGELRDKIAESVDKGEASPDAAAQLDAALDALEASLSED
jgi:eukaryotic-like serine/threonine-protein kinase